MMLVWGKAKKKCTHIKRLRNTIVDMTIILKLFNVFLKPPLFVMYLLIRMLVGMMFINPNDTPARKHTICNTTSEKKAKCAGMELTTPNRIPARKYAFLPF